MRQRRALPFARQTTGPNSRLEKRDGFLSCRLTLVLYRTRVFGQVVGRGTVFCAGSIKPLEGSRPWLRRARALWRLNEGKPAVSRVAETVLGARQMALRTDYRESVSRKQH